MFKFLQSIFFLVLLAIIAFLLYRISGQLEPQLTIDESRVTVIQKLQALQNIETASMDLTKIIEWEQWLTDYLPGFDRDDTVNNFLFKDITRMEVYGKVIAWFDLSSFTGSAVTQNNDSSLDVLLPQPVILHTQLTKDTRVYDKELWIFTKGETNTETDMRNRAIEILQTAALSGWILEEAKTNSLGVFNKLFGDGVVIRQIQFQ